MKTKNIIVMLCLFMLLLSGCSSASGSEVLDNASIGPVIELYPTSLSKLVKYSVVREGNVWKGSFYFNGDVRRDVQEVVSDVMLSCFSQAHKANENQYRLATKVLGKSLKETWQRTESVEALIYLDNVLISSQTIALDVSKKWGELQSFESIRQEIKGRKNKVFDLTRYGQNLMIEYSQIQDIVFEDVFERSDGRNGLIMRIKSDGFILTDSELTQFLNQTYSDIQTVLDKFKNVSGQLAFYVIFEDHGNVGTTMTYIPEDQSWTKGIIENEQRESKEIYEVFVGN